VIKIGDIEVRPLDVGTFRLDGGAMFRVVPRVLWEKTCPPDDANRILLAMKPLLVRALDGTWVLVESGIGSHRDDKFKSMFDVKATGLIPAIQAAGVALEEVTKIVVTHMHFDHIGGIMGGLYMFPNAKLVVQKGELADAHAQCDLCKASYIEADWRSWVADNALEVVDGNVAIAPGIEVVKTGGHTRSHQIVKFRSNGATGVFWGDLVPMTAHIKPHWVMAYDLFPMDCWEAKKELVSRAVDEMWIQFFYHEPGAAAGRVVRDGRDYRLEALS
jgi:glyoxylase-like metal-dependent hydrolase (beta-lactamase superfamily II)